MTTGLVFFIYAFTAIFVIVNPISAVMAFIPITARMSKTDRIHVAKRSVVIACIMAIIFSLTGELILEFFSITVYSLSVAGGVLFFRVAIDMLYARTSRESVTVEEMEEAEHKDNVSVFPLAMPMLTGPGAITTIIVLIKTTGDIDSKLIVIGAILLTFSITFIIFRFSDYFDKVVGVTGMLIITRLEGLFLAAVAVDFISRGIKGIFNLA